MNFYLTYSSIAHSGVLSQDPLQVPSSVFGLPEAHGSLIPQESEGVIKGTEDFFLQRETKWYSHEIWSGFCHSIQKSQTALSRGVITRMQCSCLP